MKSNILVCQNLRFRLLFFHAKPCKVFVKSPLKTSFKNRQPVEELNDELFLELYVKNAIKGWSGLKLKYLEQLAPVDLSNQDAEAELEYSEENALYLMKNSTNFDSFISEQVTDLGNFSANK